MKRSETTDSAGELLSPPDPVPHRHPGIYGNTPPFRAFLRIHSRPIFLGSFESLQEAVSARNRAVEVCDRHKAAGLPLTLSDLRGSRKAGTRSPLEKITNLLDPDADPAIERVRSKDRDRTLAKRWRTWVPAHLSLAKKIVAQAERDLARPRTHPPQQVTETAGPPPGAAAVAPQPPAVRVAEHVAGAPVGAGGQALPWEAWLTAFESDLVSRHCTTQHVRQTVRQAREVIYASGPGPLSQQNLQRAIGAIVEKGRSLRTANSYLCSLKSFMAWCLRGELIGKDVARGIRRYKSDRDRRHRRGAFTDEELARLLATAEASPAVWFGISGADRAELYHAAACTGLRLSTLRQIKVGQFYVSEFESVPHVRAFGEQLKDAEDLVIPIHPESAARLRRYLEGKPSASPAFKSTAGIWDTVRMLRKDLREAGIPYCTTTTLSNGQVRRSHVHDFHSLRMVFGTRCLRAGIPLPTVQAWMGHSTPTLTANVYSETLLTDGLKLLLKVPAIGGTPEDRQAA
jgi:integrase